MPRQTLHQKLRIWFKKQILCRFFEPIPNYCKHCGQEVRDFYVKDITWSKVSPHIRRGNTLCYNCFCDYCDELGIWGGSWELKEEKDND